MQDTEPTPIESSSFESPPLKSSPAESSPAEASLVEPSPDPKARPGINRWFSVAMIALVLGLIWFNMDLPVPDAKQPPSIMSRRGGQSAGVSPEKGFTAPDFSLPTLDGDVIRLSDLRGKPVILNFWATWCPPCRDEMPDLELLWQTYDQGDVMVLGVDQGEPPQVVESFIQDVVRTTFPILLDPRQTVGRELYWVRSLPTTFFIDPDGVIQDIYVGGPMRFDFLLERVQRLQIE
jgi:peroxiredoxin